MQGENVIHLKNDYANFTLSAGDNSKLGDGTNSFAIENVQTVTSYLSAHNLDITLGNRSSIDLSGYTENNQTLSINNASEVSIPPRNDGGKPLHLITATKPARIKSHHDGKRC